MLTREHSKLAEVSDWTGDKWDAEYKEQRKEIELFRNEIKELKEDDKAIDAISKLDSFVSIPILMNILNQIKSFNENKLDEAFTQVTKRKMSSINNNIRSVFNKFMGDIHDHYKIFTHPNKHTLKDINEEKVKTFINELSDKFYKGIIAYFKKDNFDEVVLKNALSGFMPPLFFCYFSLDIYEVSDKLQTTNSEISLGWILKSYLLQDINVRRDMMLSPFCGIKELTKCINMHGEINHLWKELALWLSGMHKRSFLFLSEKDRSGTEVILQNGEVPFVNEQDKKRYEKDKNFYKNFLIKMYDIACFYKSISESIFSKLNNVHREENTSIDSKPRLINNLFETNPIPHNKLTLPKDKLANILKESAGEQFTMLEIFLDKYQLSEMQTEIFKKYLPVIIANLESYRNDYNFIKPVHFIDAGIAIKELESTQDVKKQITSLFNLWKKITSKNSTKLLQKITHSLKELIEMLYKFEPDLHHLEKQKKINSPN